MEDLSADIKQLAERFVSEQDITKESATTIAEKIAGSDNDIWEAATSWSKNGEYPIEPNIAGRTPDSLAARRMKPTMVFTTLMSLREDPELTLKTLRHPPGSPLAKRSEDSERMELGATMLSEPQALDALATLKQQPEPGQSWRLTPMECNCWSAAIVGNDGRSVYRGGKTVVGPDSAIHFFGSSPAMQHPDAIVQALREYYIDGSLTSTDEIKTTRH